MRVAVVPYREELIEAVRDFNSRLRQAGAVTFQFPESSVPGWLPKLSGRETYQEYFVAVQNGCVRGAYILKHQPFWLRGRLKQVGNLELPLSEGVINKTYARLGLHLVGDATRQQPMLYSLGMGGLGEPVARLLAAMGWRLASVRLYFRVVRPARFLRRIAYLRRSLIRRALLDVLAVSGIGWAATHLAQVVRRRRNGARLGIEIVPQFADWCDVLWERCRDEYLMIALRDSMTLNILYPASDRGTIRLKISRAGMPIGWAVVRGTQMAGHKQFGDMKVGSVIDCLAAQEDCEAVVDAATGYLERTGVELIVSNQAARAWCQAFQRTGYLPGPSNFVFAASKDLARLIEPLDRNLGHIHLTRGDGEGPIHL